MFIYFFEDGREIDNRFLIDLSRFHCIWSSILWNKDTFELRRFDLKDPGLFDKHSFPRYINMHAGIWDTSLLWALNCKELPCDWDVLQLLGRCAYGKCARGPRTPKSTINMWMIFMICDVASLPQKRPPFIRNYCNLRVGTPGNPLKMVSDRICVTNLLVFFTDVSCLHPCEWTCTQNIPIVEAGNSSSQPSCLGSILVFRGVFFSHFWCCHLHFGSFHAHITFKSVTFFNRL